LYFSQKTLKKFFRRPAAGDLGKPGRNNLYDWSHGNHTGLFWGSWPGWAATGRPKKIFWGVLEISKSPCLYYVFFENPCMYFYFPKISEQFSKLQEILV
jgi:hypothetical protein